MKGILEECNGGTILLDQIEDMPLNTQGRIIGFLEEQKFSRVGGIKNLETNIRIISSTKTNLEEYLKKNQFREDLYFMLYVIPINVEYSVSFFIVLLRFILSNFYTPPFSLKYVYFIKSIYTYCMYM